MNELTIVSTNVDFCGSWKKAEVEQTMKELEMDGNWMDYILDHALDFQLPAEIQGIFVNNADLRKIVIYIGGDKTSIEKK